MKKSLTISLLILVSTVIVGQKKYSLRSYKGTWINFDYYLHLLNKKTDSMEYISPRFIFIDSLGGYNLEYKFEQKTKLRTQLQTKKDKSGSTLLSNKFNLISHVSDSLIELTEIGKKKTVFKKVDDNNLCIACGMQFFFDDLFWQHRKSWYLTEVNNESNPQKIIIKYGKIFLADNKTLVTHFEFSDIETAKHNNELLYQIVFFDVDKSNMSVNDRVYGIKRETDKVYLYEKDQIKYIMIPR